MSPRIPVYETRVESSGIPSAPAPRLASPDYSSASAVRQSIGGQGGLGDALSDLPKMGMATAGGELARLRAQQAQVNEAAKEASALAEAGSTLEFNRRIQARLNGDSAAGTEGFLTLKGLSASEQSAKVLADFEKDRQDVAESTSDLDARQRFLLRSSEALLAYRKQVETHVDKEFGEAKAATLKGLEAQSLSMVEGGVQDPDAYATVTKQTEQLLRENVPAAAGEAAVMDFRSKAAQALIMGQLAQGDVGSAVQLTEGMKGRLGSRYLETKAQVDRANVGRQKDLKSAAITKQVEEWAVQARDQNSYVSENALKAKAGAVGGRGIQVPEDQRDEYEAAIAKKVKAEKARLDNDIGEHTRAAERADLEGAPIPGGSVVFLEEYAPNVLRGLRAQRRARIRADRIDREGSAASKADARRAQDEIDKEVTNLYAAELYANPEADPEEFTREFITEKAKKGQDVYVTDAAVAGLKRDGAKASTGADKAEGAEAKSVGSMLEKTIRDGTPKERGEPIDEPTLKARVGAGMLRYRAMVAENGGKPLSTEQIGELNAWAMRSSAIEVPGKIPGTTKTVKRLNVDAPVLGPPAPPQAASTPTAPKKRPTITLANGQKARLSEDGKTWEPIK